VSSFLNYLSVYYKYNYIVLKILNCAKFLDGVWSPWSNFITCSPCGADVDGGLQTREKSIELYILKFLAFYWIKSRLQLLLKL